MTYLTSPAIAPELGGMYRLRAGLSAVITETLPIQGFLFWRGLILETGMRVIWYGNGQYSPVDHARNELDICEVLA